MDNNIHRLIPSPACDSMWTDRLLVRDRGSGVASSTLTYTAERRRQCIGPSSRAEKFLRVWVVVVEGCRHPHRPRFLVTLLAALIVLHEGSALGLRPKSTFRYVYEYECTLAYNRIEHENHRNNPFPPFGNL